MKQIDFNIFKKKYDIQVRFVTESDVPFILKLRTDPELSRHLHKTENNIEQQIQWIREYKKREAAGEDYYFHYSRDNIEIGVNRIYDIETDRATGGSWICEKKLPMELPVLSLIIIREIMFEQLNLQYDCFDVRKDNKKVIKTHLLFGAEKTGEDDFNNYYILTKENFYRNRNKILGILNI
ncbi:MAG: GNAT family N-acetyltransferase [Dysgonamonadaceae bacterium]|jgi:RimJ/RimL family protein N-acetyltransferase|nr:GNAT family N-acetyltransferase [Dysgonamonadaceae bacterium]